MKLKNKIIISVSALVIILIMFLLVYNSYSNKKNVFDTNTFLLKSVIKQNEKVSNELIINNHDKEQNFKINIIGLKDLASLSESQFKLSKKESKTINIDFEDKYLNYSPGVYTGKIVISADSGKKEIPVIFGIQSNLILTAVNIEISPDYKKISKGEKSVINLKFFNLNDSNTHNIEMNYAIQNFEGEILMSEKENAVISPDSTITKTVILPKDIPCGDYVYTAVAKYDNSVSTSSDIFSVSPKSIFSINSANILIIIIIIFLVGIVLLILYMIYERDKLFLQLRKQQRDEIGLYKKKIEEKKKYYIKKAKPKERKKIIRKFSKIKKTLIKKVKEKQKFQRKVFKTLKKQKKKTEIQKKLTQWKKQGFNINEAFSEKKGSAKSKMNEWKKQGYDTSFLKR